MKSIRTVQEAQAAINELYNRLDTLSVKNWDRHQTRIVNAHPSVEPYDYVVRKELDEWGKGEERVVDQGLGYSPCVFGIGVGSSGVILTGTDVCPHFISLYTLQPSICLFKVKTAPTVTPILVQVYKNGTTALFSSNINVPVGSTAVQLKSDFALTSLAFKDYLTCNVIQAGSGVPGSALTIYIRFKIIGVPNV